MHHLPLSELVFCLSRAGDMMNPAHDLHQARVAHIAGALGRTLDLRANDRAGLVIAAALHDIGIFSLHERLASLQFEYVEGPIPHTRIGYFLLHDFAPLKSVAPLVLYHHLHWREASSRAVPRRIRLLANLLHLADRVDMLIDRQQDIPPQIPRIAKAVRQASDQMFMPEGVEAFMQLGSWGSFWHGLAKPRLKAQLDACCLPDISLHEPAHLRAVTRLVSRVVDFRSSYTCAHSLGVAANAVMLAELCDLPPRQRRLMPLAGILHDLWKLAMGREVLDKPGRLSTREQALIRRRSRQTCQLLPRSGLLAPVTDWLEDFHHTGDNPAPSASGRRPCLEARILATADICAALNEDRPYRPSMHKAHIHQLLRKKGQNRELDQRLVNLLLDNYSAIDDVQGKVRQVARQDFARFRKSFFPRPVAGPAI
jgi:HD-GYP domain-containing protein (c-di-GMP phosphodiesterase class II)